MSREVLTEAQAEAFLSKFIPVAKSRLCESIDEALATGALLGYPLVLKIIAPEALHKTEIGGVKVAKTAQELIDAYDALRTIAREKKLTLDGILVQEYVSGTELFVGIKRDPAFGHVLLFGLGGIFVEVLKDVSFRVCPISEEDADQMVDELRGKRILEGVRGRPPVDRKLLRKLLILVSRIPDKAKNLLELDINPVMATEDGMLAVDARVVLE